MIELAAGRDDDLGQVAALAQIEDRILGELVGEADAARADDAALGVVDDGGAEHDGLGLVHDLLLHALAGTLMLEPVILKAALTGLIADGAVDRVVEEQELLHGGARLGHVLARLGEHFHPGGAADLAGGLELGLVVRPRSLWRPGPT